MDRGQEVYSSLFDWRVNNNRKGLVHQTQPCTTASHLVGKNHANVTSNVVTAVVARLPADQTTSRFNIMRNPDAVALLHRIELIMPLGVIAREHVQS